MVDRGRYDTSLQMFVEAPKEPRINHLRFYRWLKDNNRLGPKPLSSPRGDYLFLLSDTEIVEHAVRDRRRLIALSNYQQTIE